MKKILLILTLLMSFACRKEVEWETGGTPEMNPVIECMLTNEPKAHEVIITYPVAKLNAVSQGIAGATVKLIDGDSVYPFAEDPLKPGHYFSDSTLIGIPGHDYKLSISIGGIMYEASYTMTSGELFQPLTYSVTGPGDWFKIAEIAPLYNANQFAIYEVLIDWSHLPAYDTLEYNRNHARVLAYTLPTIDVNEILPSGTEQVVFPKGSKINMRRYSINYDHALFIRSLLTETVWNGNYFDTRSGNVSGNFSHNAYGYFSACGVTQVSLVVE